MKASELRLKNLVIVNHKTDRVAIVDSICEASVECRFVDGMAEDMATGMIVSPESLIQIPLTEEWLLRFGFIVREKTVSLNVGGELMRYAFYEEIREDKRIRFVIYFSKRHGWTLDSVTSNKETVYFISVHQLQNIFFTNVGEELTLKQE